MGNRDKWEFEYTAGDLADAAAKQKEHRLERVEWWRNKYREIHEQIKSGGVTINESVAKHISNTSYGDAPDVQIDQKLSKDLREAHSRVKIHDEAAREYEGWRQVLQANKVSRLKLNHADWLYFFGGLAIEEDDQG